WEQESDFINTAIVGPDQHEVLGDDIYIYGTNMGRNNPIALMKVNKNDIEDMSKYLYYAGLDEKGNPIWTSEEADLVHILDTLSGELSVAWNEGLDRWLLTTTSSEYGGIVI